MERVTVGHIVHVLVDPHENNGSDVAPALVVRAWGEPYNPEHDELGERQTVNLRVLLDQTDTLWLTSVPLFPARPSDVDLAAANEHNPKGYRTVAFWPPRG